MYVAFIIWAPSEKVLLMSDVFDSREKALAWVAVEQIENEEAYMEAGFSGEYIQNFEYCVAKVSK